MKSRPCEAIKRKYSIDYRQLLLWKNSLKISNSFRFFIQHRRNKHSLNWSTQWIRMQNRFQKKLFVPMLWLITRKSSENRKSKWALYLEKSRIRWMDAMICYCYDIVLKSLLCCYVYVYQCVWLQQSIYVQCYYIKKMAWSFA